MSCKRVELLLPATVDNRLDGAQQREVDEHLAGCAACTADLDAMRDARVALATCGPAEPPAGLADRIARSVRLAQPDNTPASFWERFVPIAWPTALGASVAAIVLVAVMLTSGGEPTKTATETAPADPIEQVATAVNNANVQLASNVYGLDID